MRLLHKFYANMGITGNKLNSLEYGDNSLSKLKSVTDAEPANFRFSTVPGPFRQIDQK